VACIDFEKQGGLVPVVVQSLLDGAVLMLAYADRRAIEKTMETGLAHFYSRSRRRLWMKGEESGNLLHVAAILTDCDHDAVLYMVVEGGPACHTGRRSCFHNLVWLAGGGATASSRRRPRPC